MQRTDHGKIKYPEGITSKERRFVRNIINQVRDSVYNAMQNIGNKIFIAYSTGIDSTVLAHAATRASTILKNHPEVILVYVNHNLRPEEVKLEIAHTESFAKELGCRSHVESITIDKSKNVQDDARNKRYNAISSIAGKNPVLLAHHMDDVAETKLFQFLTGRDVVGIDMFLNWSWGSSFIRPLLKLTKDDLKEYARIWNLTWREDSSNATDAYTRNKIRHHLIPWIAENVNPGIVNTLAKFELQEKDYYDE